MIALLLAAAVGASAARPVAGAYYVDYGGTWSVEFQVSRSARRLSSLAAFLNERPEPSLDAPWCAGFFADTRPRIGRRGGFRFVGRDDRAHGPGPYKVRLSGRFVSKNRARITIRLLRRPTPKPGKCETRRTTHLSVERLRRIPIKGCSSPKFKTELSTATARIFWRWEWDRRLRGIGFYGGWDRVAYGCEFSTNVPVRLAPQIYEPHDFRLAGPYSAHVQFWPVCWQDQGCVEVIRVHDLRTGRRVKVMGGEQGEFRGYVSDLELKENASIAWIAPQPLSELWDVWAYDSLGRRKLDSGNIATESLTLDGSTLMWRKDGVVRSAVLN